MKNYFPRQREDGERKEGELHEKKEECVREKGEAIKGEKKKTGV